MFLFSFSFSFPILFVALVLYLFERNYYKGGVMVPSQCAGQTDHCVLVTGWQMNNNPPYWIVRNSWGTEWGVNGYIALAYNGNTCGMADYPASCHTVNG